MEEKTPFLRVSEYTIQQRSNQGFLPATDGPKEATFYMYVCKFEEGSSYKGSI
jgi:hypothetical protein